MKRRIEKLEIQISEQLKNKHPTMTSEERADKIEKMIDRMIYINENATQDELKRRGWID